MLSRAKQVYTALTTEALFCVSCSVEAASAYKESPHIPTGLRRERDTSFFRGGSRMRCLFCNAERWKWDDE
jgi:hypothetical protein